MNTQSIKQFSRLSSELRDQQAVLFAKCAIKRGQLEAIRIEYKELVELKFSTKKAQENKLDKYFNEDLRVIEVKRDLEIYKASIRENSSKYWAARTALQESTRISRHSMSNHFKLTFGNTPLQDKKMHGFLIASVRDGLAMRFGWI